MRRSVQRGLITRLFNNRYTDRVAGVVHYWPEAALSIFSIVRLLWLRVKRKTVLLVEPNTFHGEILPGFCKYFQDLGYDVVVMCRYANYREDVFYRYVDKPLLFVFDPLPMRWVLQMKKIAAFDFVLFTSNQIFAPDIRMWGEYHGCLKSAPKSRVGNFYVEHSFHPDEKSYTTDLKDMFLLTRSAYNGVEVPMLNPHYFGEVRHTPLNQGKRVFIFVGEVSSKNSSISLLIDSVRHLEKKFEFEVWLVGKGTDTYLQESLPSSIRTFGRQSFEAMFQLLEKADFILPLLDPESDDHKKYLRGLTSGSRQLILGFCKVAVIHNEFAKAYDFSGRDSILYGNSRFSQGMERALTITEKEYADLQQGLRQLAGTVYDESLENLRKRIEERCPTGCL